MTNAQISIALKHLEEFNPEVEQFGGRANRMSRALGAETYDHDICLRALLRTTCAFTPQEIIEKMERDLREKKGG